VEEFDRDGEMTKMCRTSAGLKLGHNLAGPDCTELFPKPF